MKELEAFLDEIDFCVFKKTADLLMATDFEEISLVIIKNADGLYNMNYKYVNRNNKSFKVSDCNCQEIKDVITIKCLEYKKKD